MSSLNVPWAGTEHGMGRGCDGAGVQVLGQPLGSVTPLLFFWGQRPT